MQGLHVLGGTPSHDGLESFRGFARAWKQTFLCAGARVVHLCCCVQGLPIRPPSFPLSKFPACSPKACNGLQVWSTRRVAKRSRPKMKVASLFTGAGGLDLGLHRAGHEIILQCEADAAARQVRSASKTSEEGLGECAELLGEVVRDKLQDNLVSVLDAIRGALTRWKWLLGTTDSLKQTCIFTYMQLLKCHFPGVHLVEDVASISSLPKETELLAAGFPCIGEFHFWICLGPSILMCCSSKFSDLSVQT